MFTDIGLEWGINKCAAIHLKRGKLSTNNNSTALPVSNNCTIPVLSSDDHYKFLGKYQNSQHLEDKVIVPRKVRATNIYADITPLHKKGSKSSRENYRPISLTSIACKIGEKIIFDRMIKFWREIDLINSNQFGFLRERSTATQLLSTFNDWAKSRNLSIPTDVIFLDLAKAFDSVPHERLLLKLKSNGIDSSLLNWLRHFLVGRKQRVVVSRSCSDWSCVTSGTPQGTSLGLYCSSYTSMT